MKIRSLIVAFVALASFPSVLPAANKGGMTVGKWTTLNDNPTLISTHTDAEGNVRKMAVEYVKTDANTITVKLHAVGDDGQPAPAADREVIFKRQP